MKNSDTLKLFVDYNDVTSAISKKQEKLFESIESDVSSEISKMKPCETLTFSLVRNGVVYKSVPPKASKEYASIMLNFLRGNDYKSYQVESAITPIVLKSVENSIVKFYSSKDVVDKIVEVVSASIKNSNIIHAAVGNSTGETTSAIKKEISIQIANAHLDEFKNQALDQITEAVVNFLHSNIMQQLLNIIGSFIATSAGKALITKMAIIISKSISVAAIKAIVVSIIKKIGISAIVKTAIGKALITFLALIGISGKAAIFIILIPLIAGILVYEYKTFPKKLSKRIPPMLIADLRVNFDELNKDVVGGILSNMSKELAK